MSKNDKNSVWKQSYKPKMKVSKIMALKREHPDYMFAAVRTDEAYDPNGLNLEEYLNNGWEVVVSDEALDDDYVNNTSNLKKDPLKPTPIVQRGRGKASFVYVTKLKDEFRKSEQERVKRDKAAFIASSKGSKIDQKGSQLKITDSEVNMNNINEQSNDN